MCDKLDIQCCPFCGAGAELEVVEEYRCGIVHRYYRIECSGSPISHSLDWWEETEIEAIRIWNQRAYTKEGTDTMEIVKKTFYTLWDEENGTSSTKFYLDEKSAKIGLYETYSDYWIVSGKAKVEQITAISYFLEKNTNK